jgi:hypothetical protein
VIEIPTRQGGSAASRLTTSISRTSQLHVVPTELFSPVVRLQSGVVHFPIGQVYSSDSVNIEEKLLLASSLIILLAFGSAYATSLFVDRILRCNMGNFVRGIFMFVVGNIFLVGFCSLGSRRVSSLAKHVLSCSITRSPGFCPLRNHSGGPFYLLQAGGFG